MNAQRILMSVLVIGIVGGSAGFFTNAYFSDTETSANNTFTAGKLDLKINGENNPAPIINFTDLKPGDEKTFNKTLLVDDNPAWVWLHIKDLVTSQGTQTEPEIAEEGGTAKSDIQNYLKYTLSLPGPINLITDLLLPDAVSCWIPIGQIPGAANTLMKQTFKFDSTVTNWAQGDTLTFTEEFYAVQVRNNPNPAPPPSTRTWNGTKCI